MFINVTPERIKYPFVLLLQNNPLAEISSDSQTQCIGQNLLYSNNK